MTEKLDPTSLREAMRRGINLALLPGKITGQKSVPHLNRILKRVLQDQVDQGLVTSFAVNSVQTAHQSKSRLGKVKDFIRWKTRFKKWYYKPFYVKIPLGDRLQRLREYSSAFDELDEEDFERLLEPIRGTTVWEEHYPEDPYSVVISDISIQPVTPVNFINISFEV